MISNSDRAQIERLGYFQVTVSMKKDVMDGLPPDVSVKTVDRTGG